MESTPSNPPAAPTGVNILAILNELASGLGRDAVHTACLQFVTGKKTKKVPKMPKVPKEKKPRGKSSWNVEVDKVLEEMRSEFIASGKSEEEAKKEITYKMAMTEAGRRRKDAPAAPAEAKAPVTAEPIIEMAPESDDDGGGSDGIEVDGVPSSYDPATVYQFLFDLQDSGIINMMACAPELQNEFGMTRKEAEAVRSEYMSRYSELKKKYGPAPVVEVPQVPTTPARRTSMHVPNAPKKPLSSSRGKIPIV